MIGLINKLFKKKTIDKEAFQKKFRSFQALISANDEAHKSMSYLAEMLISGKPFSRSYALRNFSDLIDNTYKMINEISAMSGGNFATLKTKLNEILNISRVILSPRKLSQECWECKEYNCHVCTKIQEKIEIPYYYLLNEIDDRHYLQVGSKMSRLGEIHNKLGIPVPEGFSLTVRVFEEIMTEGNLRTNKDAIFYNLDFDNIEEIARASYETQQLFATYKVPPHIEKIILEAFDKVFCDKPDTKIAVRSSAIGEDSSLYSFAGLHRSILNVSRENLIDASLEVLISKYSPQSVVYRYISGLRDEDMPMSVACIKMIDASAGGVLYTKDPENIENGIVIQAVYGLGTQVVEGGVKPQQFIVEPNPQAKILKFESGRQTIVNEILPTEGVANRLINKELNERPCLNDEQVQVLTNYALKIEDHYKCSQDIEWVVDKYGQVFIVQARPLIIKSHEKVTLEKKFDINELDKKYKVLINSGDCASSGIAYGKVILIEGLKDIKKIENGDIIVAKKNMPEFSGLIHKISAIITDAGSTTGHLAIIAREQKVPLFTNTQTASKLLKSGDYVTLIAQDKRVYNGKVEEVINLIKQEPVSQFEDFKKSPLYMIWDRLTKFILKLNLIDPNSEKFRASNCETIHDIIRFTHQMAMKIMFSLYEDESVDSGKTYSLKIDIPLDICVIDLGNGLKGNYESDSIDLEDINSKPFLALLKGMTTPGIRWGGHLPMDTKGFVGLIFGSIVDVNRSDAAFGSRSYVLVSDKYVNFFSRLGYHFSRLDAFASDEINNNYINFNFRGGAADDVRKIRRVLVIKKILEHLGFSTVVNYDNVIGTIKKIPKNEIYHLVSEIGRLMGAVRNTDVIMMNEAIMDEFVKAFLEGDPAPALRFRV